MDGPAAAPRWIGRAMPRREDARMLAGQGRFVADLGPPGCLHLVFLRSAWRAGRVARLDTSAACAMPGVRAVLTAEDLVWHAQASVNPLIPGARVCPLEPLAGGRVAAAGQAVAAVVAATAEAARDAAEAIELSVDEAAGADAPAVAALFGAAGPLPAGVRVAARVDHARVAPMALEPRAALAVPGGGGLTLWLATQTPQRCRDDLAAMLGLPRDAVRVVAPDVGGAFGGKASLMPEDAVVAAAALRLGAPVLWVATRSEDFLAATQGRGACTAAEAVLAGGRIAALRARMTFPLGHWMPHSALAPARNGGRIPPGPYAIADCGVRVEAAATEGPAVSIYRGAGRPEAAMLVERLMDRAAAACGADPLAFRRAHLSGAGPRACSGDMAGLLGAVAADYPALRAAPRGAARRARSAASASRFMSSPAGRGGSSRGSTSCPTARSAPARGRRRRGRGARRRRRRSWRRRWGWTPRASPSPRATRAPSPRGSARSPAGPPRSAGRRCGRRPGPSRGGSGPRRPG
jgi:carbon-monoxide dehydrogenase large subunit